MSAPKLFINPSLHHLAFSAKPVSDNTFKQPLVVAVEHRGTDCQPPTPKSVCDESDFKNRCAQWKAKNRTIRDSKLFTERLHNWNKPWLFKGISPLHCFSWYYKNIFPQILTAQEKQYIHLSQMLRQDLHSHYHVQKKLPVIAHQVILKWEGTAGTL